MKLSSLIQKMSSIHLLQVLDKTLRLHLLQVLKKTLPPNLNKNQLDYRQSKHQIIIIGEKHPQQRQILLYSSARLIPKLLKCFTIMPFPNLTDMSLKALSE